MKCLSCGSNDIVKKVCEYCGAVVQASSISSLRALPKDALSAFHSEFSESKLGQIPHDEQISATLTQVLVLLERKQWSDALAVAETARRKMPDVVSFVQYSLVASVAGNFLKRKSLDEVREATNLLVGAGALTPESSNLNGYVISCINAMWCGPNRLKEFVVPAWEADDEVVAVSQFFSNEHLAKASLLFDEDGSVKEPVDEKLVARRARIQAIIKESDSSIEALLRKHEFSSIESLIEGVERLIKKPQKARGMIELLVMIGRRNSGYLDGGANGAADVGDGTFDSEWDAAIATGARSIPFFGGGAAKAAFFEIYKVVEAERKKVKALATFL